MALPSVTQEATSRPWNQPCTPYANTDSAIDLNIDPEDAPSILKRLKYKTKETFYHVTSLEKAMDIFCVTKRSEYLFPQFERASSIFRQALRFNDAEIVSYLEMKTLSGFPEIPSSQNNTQNKSASYSEAFVALSKVAVFLEQMYSDEDNSDMKYELDDLQSENFSQLCELQMWLRSTGVNEMFETPRSVMSHKLRHAGNTFKRYERDFVVISRYGKLLRRYQHYYN
ncbi:uncharacterized protein LOC118762197 [Octopus sinensis]|uniref:Uncharacterized protein LOC118762197 n=1 Tax=Octopus sinensis TaxID=2607531 RepID=A0A7E6ELZ6_9MOLL|nr:uncharacterized protein LOC118762197 [Octopus sinensis]